MQKPRNEFRFRVLWLLLMSVSTEARRVPSLLDEGGPLHFGRCQTSPSHVACRHSSLSAMAFAAATSIGSLWMPSRIRFAVRGAANPTHKQSSQQLYIFQYLRRQKSWCAEWISCVLPILGT